MAEQPELHHPWLVAIWPGMGGVALNAGIYLLSKLQMEVFAVLDSGELFDIDHVVVQEGIIRAGQRPRNQFFLWKDPNKKHDLVVFLGEAQPPIGKFAFCRHLIRFAQNLGVERVLTFAAMATQMHPEHRSRIFAAATNESILNELKTLDLEVLDDGHIGGLNGLLLGVAAENKLDGACLLGELPHIFSQIAFPKASLAIIEAFQGLTGIELDTAELAEQVRLMDEKLGEMLSDKPPYDEEALELGAQPEDEQGLKAVDQHRIDSLFERAKEDRAKAFELKQELDRLGVFKEYEDRFLDLFRKSS